MCSPDWKQRLIISVAIAALCIAGFVLRLAQSRGWGLTHFDEGIYALAATWITSPRGLAGINPRLIPYAPPLFVILAGWANLILGIGAGPPILVSLLAAAATIPVVYFLGRRVGGPATGIAAASCAAWSGPHVAFSGMALVDCLALLAWCLALLAAFSFLDRPGPVRAILLGLAVGAAQLAKYSGFLSGLIVAAAALAGLVVPSERSRSRAMLLWGLLAVVAAGLLYLPWFQFVEAHGGYADLLRHQRGYTTGPTAWLQQLRLQLAQQTALSGQVGDTGLSWAAWGAGLSWILAWWILCRASTAVRNEALAPSPAATIMWIGSLILVVIGFGFLPTAFWWASGLVAAFWLFRPEPGLRLMAWWWLVMTVMTPMYHPYARLWLPIHAASWILIGHVIATASRGPRWPAVDDSATLRFGWNRAMPFLLGGLMLAAAERLVFTAGSRPLPGLFSGRSHHDPTVAALASRHPDQLSLIRPPDRFELALTGARTRLRELASLDALPGITSAGSSLLIDTALLKDPSEDLARLDRAGWVLQEQVEYVPSLPTRLDQNPGEALGNAPRRYQILRFERQAP